MDNVNAIITSVWSDYGHVMMGTGDYTDARLQDRDGVDLGITVDVEYDSCMTCGGLFLAVPQVDRDELDADGQLPPDVVERGYMQVRGIYVAANGDETTTCTGDTAMVHGGGHCPCTDGGDEFGCRHCRHDCNCHWEF